MSRQVRPWQRLSPASRMRRPDTTMVPRSHKSARVSRALARYRGSSQLFHAISNARAASCSASEAKAASSTRHDPSPALPHLQAHRWSSRTP